MHEFKTWGLFVKGGHVKVVGHLHGDQRLYCTSPVKQVNNINSVTTISDKTYSLNGHLNEEWTSSMNVPRWFYVQFLTGFPDNWQELLQDPRWSSCPHTSKHSASSKSNLPVKARSGKKSSISKNLGKPVVQMARSPIQTRSRSKIVSTIKIEPKKDNFAMKKCEVNVKRVLRKITRKSAISDQETSVSSTSGSSIPDQKCPTSSCADVGTKTFTTKHPPRENMIKPSVKRKKVTKNPLKSPSPLKKYSTKCSTIVQEQIKITAKAPAVTAAVGTLKHFKEVRELACAVNKTSSNAGKDLFEAEEGAMSESYNHDEYLYSHISPDACKNILTPLRKQPVNSRSAWETSIDSEDDMLRYMETPQHLKRRKVVDVTESVEKKADRTRQKYFKDRKKLKKAGTSTVGTSKSSSSLHQKTNFELSRTLFQSMDRGEHDSNSEEQQDDYFSDDDSDGENELLASLTASVNKNKSSTKVSL